MKHRQMHTLRDLIEIMQTKFWMRNERGTERIPPGAIISNMRRKKRSPEERVFFAGKRHTASDN